MRGVRPQCDANTKTTDSEVVSLSPHRDGSMKITDSEGGILLLSFIILIEILTIQGSVVIGKRSYEH